MTAPLTILQPDLSLLLVVDIQEKLLPSIYAADDCVAAAGRMIDIARALDLPVVATEQYPSGLGRTDARLREKLGDGSLIEKTRFSACVQPVLDELDRQQRPNVVVTGIEAHVCVQQTVLDLLRLGFGTWVCADGVSSRRVLDRDTALARMRQAGAIVTTTESVAFELLGEAGTEAFKRVLRIVK